MERSFLCSDFVMVRVGPASSRCSDGRLGETERFLRPDGRLKRRQRPSRRARSVATGRFVRESARLRMVFGCIFRCNSGVTLGQQLSVTDYIRLDRHLWGARDRRRASRRTRTEDRRIPLAARRMSSLSGARVRLRPIFRSFRARPRVFRLRTRSHRPLCARRLFARTSGLVPSRVVHLS